MFSRIFFLIKSFGGEVSTQSNKYRHCNTYYLAKSYYCNALIIIWINVRVNTYDKQNS